MKNTLTRICMFILLLAVGACKKDDENTQKTNAFIVKVTQNVAIPYAVTSKDDIVFDITIASGSSHKIKDAVLSLDRSDLKSATISSENTIDLKHTYQVEGADVGKSLIFRLKVSDEEGNVVDKDFTVYVQAAPADVDIIIPSTAPQEIKDNESVDFNVSIVSENDIKYIKTFLDQTEVTSLTKETFTNPKQDTYNFKYQATVADADKTLSFTIEVMDVLGNIVKQAYSLNVKRSQEADFAAYFDVNLGAQRNTTTGPFFNASTGEVYMTTGAAAKSQNIDLVTFYSGSTNAYNFTSPTLATVSSNIYTVALYGQDAMANWPVRKQTFIKKITLTRTEFDLVSSASEIQNLYTGSSVVASETSGGMADNHVIVFKTAEDKYGLLYAKSRSANANTGFITVDVKVQK